MFAASRNVSYLKSTVFWDAMPCNWQRSNDVLKKHAASIFRVQNFSKLYSVPSQKILLFIAATITASNLTRRILSLCAAQLFTFKHTLLINLQQKDLTLKYKIPSNLTGARCNYVKSKYRNYCCTLQCFWTKSALYINKEFELVVVDRTVSDSITANGVGLVPWDRLMEFFNTNNRKLVCNESYTTNSDV